MTSSYRDDLGFESYPDELEFESCPDDLEFAPRQSLDWQVQLSRTAGRLELLRVAEQRRIPSDLSTDVIGFIAGCGESVVIRRRDWAGVLSRREDAEHH